MTTIVIANLDYLTLVVAGSVMIVLSEPAVPGNRAALGIFLLGVFAFVIGVLRALQGAIGL